MKYMHVSNKIIVLGFLFLYVHTFVDAQSYSHYELGDYEPFSRYLYRPGANFHTAIRNYRMDEVGAVVNTDSVLYLGLKTPNGKLNFWQRIWHDDLLKWDKEDIQIVINPVFNFEGGYEKSDGANTYVNTRGVFVKGQIGRHFSFYTDFVENQAVLPNYLDDFARQNEIVPGQGKRKNFGSNGHDYAQATGYISFNMAKYFNLQLGHGKHFIGDGYRSLLLSDVAFSYPYLKLSASFWNIKYQVMWNKMLHLERDKSLGDTRYPGKYGVSHYLDWNVGKRFSLGLFSNVVWAEQDTVGQRGFDVNYLNPVIFVRPVEYSLGSPDNVTMGLNTKYVFSNHVTAYGQFVLAEFKFDEVFSGDKWWANKQGFQLGVRTFDLLNIKNLDLQLEYNQARPYTYSHYTPIYAYGHYNQPMAHLLGGNFREGLGILRYRYRRLLFKAQLNKSMYGDDFGDGVSWGKNVFMPSTTRPQEYGHEIGQGLKTEVMNGQFSVSYLINPKNMFNIIGGVHWRHQSNDLSSQETQFVYLGIRTSLKNVYYDF
jgi:hypothetical protein